MRIIFYKDAPPIKDHEVEDFVINYYKKDKDLYTSNGLVILAARTLIVEKKLNHKEVEFWVCSSDKDHGRSIGFCSMYGRLMEYPDGIDEHHELLSRLCDVTLFSKQQKRGRDE